jgi:hypothetical protein
VASDQVYGDISIVLLALTRNESEICKLYPWPHLTVNTKITTVSSGSLAEGLDLPGSDIDIMFVFNNVNILQNVQHMNRSARHTTLLIEDDMEFPGFTTLKLIAEGDAFTSPEYFVETTNGMYFSNISFIRKLIEISANLKQSAHDPCLSDKDEAMDTAYIFHFHSWSRQAEQPYHLLSEE